MGLITSLLVLSFLIFFHELGHFLVARFFGVFVETFSIGFGKKIFSYKKENGTEYCISAIPLGGYVKMKGQDDLDPLKKSSDEDSYNSKKPWQRIMILLAGPFANIFLALILYFFVGVLGIPKFAPIIGDIAKNSPAFEAKLHKNDKILEIDGKKVKSWSDIGNIIINSKNSILNFKIERGDRVLLIKVKPKISKAKNMFGEEIKKRMVGIAPSGESIRVRLGFFESLNYAFDETIRATTLIIQSVKKLITGIIPSSELGGVVSIVKLTADATSMGIVYLFIITALLSVNLGVLNLLPIPALDGGHIIFNIYEMVTGKEASEEVMYQLTVVGWILLIGLMFLGLYNDVNRLLK